MAKSLSLAARTQKGIQRAVTGKAEGDETVSYRGKSIVESRTVWVNIVSLVVTIAAMPELQKLLGPDAMQYVAAVVAVLNIALRFLTVRPVTFSAPGESKPVQVQKLA